ncbi:MAG TPA: GNAT family N-acetyltransferase [Ktedonobacterales bacterium]|jgi:enamine deaminase RidA (YjgF/YER057c/UK114 family)/GNAT superfamily N-acetyltransferase
MTANPAAGSVTIRPATVDDTDAMAAVLRAAFAEYAPLYTPEGLAATTPESAVLRARLADGPAWVATRSGEVLGTLGAEPRGTTLYLRSMAVLPTARGGQVGARLFAAAEAWARAHGHTRLLLSTTPFLDRAIRLYERLGMARDASGPGDLHGTPLFAMRKELPPTEGAHSMVEREHVSTNTPWEPVVGYARAVRVREFRELIFVTGTTATDEQGNVVGAGDAAGQTRQALANIERALARLGASMADVVRTRMFVTDITRWEEIGRVHGEVFGAVLPATTMVEVSRLIDPRMLVEIEADAVR